MDIGREIAARLRASGAALPMVLVRQAQRRIRTRGSDVGGYARLWADTAKVKVWKGRGKNRTQVDLPHYRAGGTPLADTGNLVRSLNGTFQFIPNGFRLFLRGPLYAVFQHHGFRTSGPNFIPFTRAAARKDAKALKKGQYLYAKDGVTVPARRIFAMPSSAKVEVARAIARVLGAR